MPVLPSTVEVSRTIGKLCVAGDWACAHGDYRELRFIVLQLAEYTAEPLHCQLAQLAILCKTDPRRAAARWSELKDRIYREAR